MAVDKCQIYLILILTVSCLKSTCYEKTLRKIVRNQSKMVQRPFSDTGSSDNHLIWESNSVKHGNLSIREPLGKLPNYAQVKTFYHKIQHPKISTIISSVETGRGKSTYPRTNIGKNDYLSPNELRLTRNTLANLSMALQWPDHNIRSERMQKVSNTTFLRDIALETFHYTQTSSPFFPSIMEQSIQSDALTSFKEEESIIIPERHESSKHNGSIVQGIFIANRESSRNLSNSQIPKTDSMELDPNFEKADFLIVDPSVYTYNMSVNPHTCVILQESKADIDVSRKYAEINIEPPWIVKKQFWNHIFDSRYESLMRSPKWPALKVILIPRTHVDTIWKRTFEQYHNDSVHKILSNIVKKLQFYTNLTFTWNEVSHLSRWWKTTTQKNREAFRRLLKSGRLEITTGGWVESDEATSHLFGLVHQLIEGRQWLYNNLNYSPVVGWLTNTVSHSSTMSYLLSASGISYLVFTNLHYSWEQYFAEYQLSDFVWLQNWYNDASTSSKLNDDLAKIGKDRLPSNAVLTHYLQFNSAGFKACGPNGAICATEFNFAKSNHKNHNLNVYNIKEKSEILLEQYSKSGTLTPHNVIIAPIGAPFRYESQPEFDYQYNNYEQIANFVNVNREIYKATLEFGTPINYFNNILKVNKNYPTLKGDFVNFADVSSGRPAYWTGFFTSRPLFKILLRRLQSALRSTEILFSSAINNNSFRGANITKMVDLLIKVRESVARFQDRNVVGGTLTVNILKYAYKRMLATIKKCWHLQEVTASLLSAKSDESTPYLHKYVYRDGEFVSDFKTISLGDQIYIFNSLSNERTEVVELLTSSPNIRIVNHKRKDVTIQINPVWNYFSNNFIKISRRYFKINFVIVVPAMTLELYKIKETYDATQFAATIYCTSCVIEDVDGNAALFPFSIQPIQKGDIQLESYKHRLIFDETIGFLKTVIEKETNTEKTLIIDYSSFRSSDYNSGTFLFSTNRSKPLDDFLMPYRVGTKSKIVMIISGLLTTEFTSIYGPLLQHSVKIFNMLNSPLSNAIYIESKVDYEMSPKNREMELFMSIQTDIANNNPPEIITDSNGFQYQLRVMNISRRIESNVFPITSMAFIQDRRSRLTFLTNHAQGITAFHEGQLVVILDRRILFNDRRGTNEGLADSSATWHRNIILLENLYDNHNPDEIQDKQINLPSLLAVYFANSLNYLVDIFVFNKNQANQSFYAFLPLVKTSFPCDVTVVNYRVVLNKINLEHYISDTALMILHRQSFSCEIDYGVLLHCNGDVNFSLQKILRNVKGVYQTNLVATSRGLPVTHLTHANFPPMELTTLRIYF